MEWFLNVRGVRRRFVIDDELTTSGWAFRFPYHPAVVAEVKAMQGAKWEPDTKTWSVPITERNVYAISILEGNYDRHYDTDRLRSSTGNDNGRLLVHQQRIKSFIQSYQRVLIASRMGTGKTFACLSAFADIERCLVIAPRSALLTWKSECYKWGFAELINKWTFTTYESAWKIFDRNLEHTFDAVIFDESVKIKTPSAQRSKVAAEIAKQIRDRHGFIVCLSGTVAPRDPRDWWHQVEVLRPGWVREGSPDKLGYRLGIWDRTGPYPKFMGWKRDEVEAFGRRIAPLCLVIRAEDVLDLPPKVYETVYCQPDQEFLDTAKFIADNESHALTALTRLRQLSDGFNPSVGWIPGNPKETKLRDRLAYYADGDPPRIVVYAAFREAIENIDRICKEEGWTTGLSYGATTLRDDFLKLFQSDSATKCVTIANPGCTHGLNLQASPGLLYYSNSFVLEDRLQSLERVDRLGRTGGACRVEDFICLPTDQLVLDNLNAKKEVLDLTMDSIRETLACIQQA